MSKEGFIESIAVVNHAMPLLTYHQQRMDNTYWDHYHKKNPFQIARLIPQIPSHELYKFRVAYNKEIEEVSLIKYKKRPVTSLQTIEAKDINYHYKYSNRDQLRSMYEQRGTADDVMILVDGAVTDSYYANLAFYDGTKWFTPDTHLLNGVKRQQLLDSGQLTATHITRDDIKSYQKVSLINALLDLGEVEISCEAIQIPS